MKLLIVEKKALDINFIKRMQYKLMKGTYDDIRYHDKQERSGEFKIHDYVTGKNEIGRYPHEVESDVKELLSETAVLSKIKIAVFFYFSVDIFLKCGIV